jgi:GNAT superfamily N-acetyltransferase
MILRPATPEDAHAIAAILSDWVDRTDWMPRVHSLDEDRSFGTYLVDRTVVTVAEEDARVLGFLARRESQVEALYVRGGRRGQGVGRALMDRAMAECAELGLWCFVANAAARGFYARLGFVEDARTDGAGNDEGLPDVHLVWRRDAEDGS